MSANGPEIKATITGDASQAIAALEALRAVMQQGSSVSDQTMAAFHQVTQSARDQARAISTLKEAYQLQHAEAFEDLALMQQTGQVVQQVTNIYIGLQYALLQHLQSMQQLSQATQTVSMNTTILSEVTKTYGVNSIQAIQANQQLVESMNRLAQEQTQAKMANLQYLGSLVNVGTGALSVVSSVALLGGTLASRGIGAGMFEDVSAGAAGLTATIAALIVGLGLGMLNVAQFKTSTDTWGQSISQAVASLSGWPPVLKQVAEGFTYAGGYVDEFDITTLGNLKASLSNIMPTMAGWSTSIVKMFLTIPEHASQLISGTQFAMTNVESAFLKGFAIIQSYWDSAWKGLGAAIGVNGMNIGAAAKSLWDLITSTLSSWGSALISDWDKVWAGLGPAVSGIAGAVESGVSSLLGMIKGAVDSWGSALESDWSKGWSTLGAAVKVASSAIIPAVTSLLTSIKSGLDSWGAQIAYAWKTGWDSLGKAVSVVSGPLSSDVKTLLNDILKGIDSWGVQVASVWKAGWTGLPNDVMKGLAAVSSTWSSWKGAFAADWVKFWNILPQAFGGLGASIGSAMRAALTGVVAPINQFIQSFNQIINSIDALPFVLTKIPDIPLMKLGTGGIVSSPTLALLGESGPEAVIPLDNSGGGAGTGGGGATNITINVYNSGSVVTMNQLVQELDLLLMQQFTRLRR